MKKILVPVVIALMSFTTLAVDWQKVSLLEKVTVSMPGVPTEEKVQGMPAKKIALDDSTQLIAAVVDFSTYGLTEEMLAAMAGTDEFKTQMEQGVAMQPGVKLVKNETGKYQDKYVVYDMTLTIDNKEYKGTMQQRMVYYKSYAIALTFRPGVKGEDVELREKFFNSLKIEE